MKSLFHVPAKGPYLLAHSVGCQPLGTQERLARDFLAPWRDTPDAVWQNWLDTITAFREALATLLGGDAADWCPQTSISGAISRFLSGIPVAPGRSVVLASHEAFPSVGFALAGLARLGLRLELIRGAPDRIDSWARLADPDVAAVVLTHVHSNSGRISPVAELAARARAHGVLTVVDIAQSAGILPIDVTAWPVDAVAGTSLKWLCGGPGGCFLWVSPTIAARIEPVERGWFSHRDPFEMDIEHFLFAPDARRFWGGTPSIAPYVSAREGLDLIGRIGVDAIRAHNLRLARRFLDAASGVAAPAAALEERGGTLCLELGAEAEAALAAAGVQCDRRGKILRLSFGAWNDEADAEIAARAVSGVVSH
ncbi:aminotransferase class V-fold PLP-dependent enzyme [Hephaestia mangrovi]|uniref:aminotransferase class V-fold PLP-dependent enzyme n=1 Tax=Hephaestia mangrovi TaxID=2873268 RepID=UPI001CA78CA3|nr:aminotransferase class V-fold PLP-dependent enzyme [Hephaestia mangrovi]MBY8829333.1 aminotransferase class V-fold PLP-dependent enzyme [Hephaestia mangrovi]